MIKEEVISMEIKVATTEVKVMIMKEANLADCVVYEVFVSGCEETAGMAVLTDTEKCLDVN